MGMPLVNGNLAVMMNTYENTNVESGVYDFLKRHNIGNGDKLVSTAKEYERDIKRFFKLMFGKDLDEVEVKDLDLLPNHIEVYQTYLVDMGYSSNTVNRNIGAIRALYGYFEENRYHYTKKQGKKEQTIYITSAIFKKIKNVELNDSNSYGMLFYDEVQQMIEQSKSYENGLKKSLAIELASVTAYRIEAIVSLNYKENFTYENGVWVIKIVDKNKTHIKPITEDLYSRLLATKDPDSDSVFNFTARTLQRTIEKLIQQLELNDDRNITFHSLKKYSMYEVYKITNGDFLAVAQHGNHSSFETSMKYYMLFSKDYSKSPALLINKPVEVDVLDDMSKEELLELIKSSSRVTQYELTNLAKGVKSNAGNYA